MSRASSAARWPTNRGRRWWRARSCRPAAQRRTRRSRSASRSPSRCRRAPGWAAAAPASPMRPTRNRRTTGCPRRCCSRRSRPAGSPRAPTGPAAVPMLARGLYLLHARYGRRPFESLIVPAEQLARFGTPASRALVRDLTLVAGPLFADPNARAVFSQNGSAARRGPAAAAARSRRDAVADPRRRRRRLLHRRAGATDRAGLAARRRPDRPGRPARRVAAAWRRRSCCRTATTRWRSCRRRPMAAWPPPPGSWRCSAMPSAYGAAAARALAVSARWRAGGVDAQGLLAASDLQEAPLPSLPASTSFATLDKDGNAVACALSMDNLFGTGRVLPGLGFLLAASPAVVPPPLYAAAIAWNDNTHAFRAAVAGSGQAGAPIAVAVGMLNALRTNQPMAVARAGSRPRQCDRMQPLPAGRERQLRLGQRSARCRPRGRRHLITPLPDEGRRRMNGFRVARRCGALVWRRGPVGDASAGRQGQPAPTSAGPGPDHLPARSPAANWASASPPSIRYHIDASALPDGGQGPAGQAMHREGGAMRRDGHRRRDQDRRSRPRASSSTTERTCDAEDRPRRGGAAVHRDGRDRRGQRAPGGAAARRAAGHPHGGRPARHRRAGRRGRRRRGGAAVRRPAGLHRGVRPALAARADRGALPRLVRAGGAARAGRGDGRRVGRVSRWPSSRRSIPATGWR